MVINVDNKKVTIKNDKIEAFTVNQKTQEATIKFVKGTDLDKELVRVQKILFKVSPKCATIRRATRCINIKHIDTAGIRIRV